jgi:hypothetical protein
VPLRDRVRGLLAPEAKPEPLLLYQTGAPALKSFGAFLLLLGPLGGVLFAMADSDGPALWVVPLAIGLPAFACAFLLPRRRRRIVAALILVLNILALIAVVVLVIWLLILVANCPPDAYECPF